MANTAASLLSTLPFVVCAGLLFHVSMPMLRKWHESEEKYVDSKVF